MILFRLVLATIFVTQFSGTVPTEPAVIAPVPASVTPSTEVEDNETLPWFQERRLSWEDFLADPKRNTDAVASTSTSLGIAYQAKNGRLNYDITCKFSKVKSWGLIKTDYILAHEQGHFDITEICARKLHQALQAYQFDRKNFKEDINFIYQEIVKEKEALQEAYDGETDHSRNRKQQMAWLDKIQEMLAATADHAVYP
jgi:hypothetical protein